MAVQGDKIVTIKCDGTTCTVSPRETDVDAGDNVVFQNMTGDSIAILIAEEKMFKDYNFGVDPGEEVSMAAQSVESGESLYAVFCREIDDFAQASSMPKIIVRPK